MDARAAVDLNLTTWDERAVVHAASPDYGFEVFICDQEHLSDVVSFDRPLLGDIAGQRGIHLQCHLGTDTLSLARLGAHMTGVDFSPNALEQARTLAARADADIDYHQVDVSDGAAVLAAVGAGRYDLVYTGIGALCWLPRITDWAQLVADLLAPGGRLLVRDGHPALNALDQDRTDGELVLSYPWFEREEPTVFDEPGTYVATEHVFTHTRSAEWNHGLGELVTAVLAAGLQVTGLTEHRSIPWQAMAHMVEVAGGEWALPGDAADRVPLSFTLQAVKPA
ncbi:class I SAM-dependent methyltransferase [Quadrisphaera granulorum]|uniref:class I SAM-dependent methyltransferase n=1 Tax=Quadrisphaera granulorum TaxID=317664 RepID=UPI001C499109|nr:class I SAM-dependent methyltransferase [Quadrisphaera granulorum]